LILRYLRDPLLWLPNNVVGPDAKRATRTDIRLYLDGIRFLLDVDGNGSFDPLVDGQLIVRYLLGFRGSALVAGLIPQSGTPPPRATPAAIEAYLAPLMQ